jgi:hypothetical protein
MKQMKKNTLFTFLLFTFFFSISSINSQRVYKETNSGYLGKRFYIAPSLGNSNALIIDDFGGSFFPNINLGYAVSKKYELATITNFQNYNYKGEDISTYTLGLKLLKTNMVAPIGVKFGTGIAYSNYKVAVDTFNYTLTNLSGVMCLEKMVPLSNRLMVTVGLDVFINLKILNVEDSKFFQTEPFYTINSIRTYFGLGFLLF